jgi:peroxiredoxin
MRRILRVFALVGMAAAVLAAAEVPRRADEFALQLATGKQVLLSQYRGKVVALGFYFTTCPHCQHTCQYMEKLTGELGARGFRTLGVFFREGDSLFVSSFATNFKLTFPVAYSPRETVYGFLREDGNTYSVVPQMVLVDRQGVIRYQSPHAGDNDFFKEEVLRKRIEELLNEPAGKAPPRSSARKRSN